MEQNFEKPNLEFAPQKWSKTFKNPNLEFVEQHFEKIIFQINLFKRIFDVSKRFWTTVPKIGKLKLQPIGAMGKMS